MNPDIRLDQMLEDYAGGILVCQDSNVLVLAILRGIETTNSPEGFESWGDGEGFGYGYSSAVGHGDGFGFSVAFGHGNGDNVIKGYFPGSVGLCIILGKKVFWDERRFLKRRYYGP